MPKEALRLGLQNTHDFWESLKITGLKRLHFPTNWRRIHCLDAASPNIVFDPFSTTEDTIKTTLKNISKPMWKQVYRSLLKCKANLII